MIVYISIGNSDDKLSQADWSAFVRDVDNYVDFVCDGGAATVHGRWFSASDAAYQNACWCVAFVDDDHLGSRAGWLRDNLPALAKTYRQDSIAWAEATTEFIGAPRG